ncbi:hypothetical protein IC582_004214 [Cucumis melo]
MVVIWTVGLLAKVRLSKTLVIIGLVFAISLRKTNPRGKYRSFGKKKLENSNKRNPQRRRRTMTGRTYLDMMEVAQTLLTGTKKKNPRKLAKKGEKRAKLERLRDQQFSGRSGG